MKATFMVHLDQLMYLVFDTIVIYVFRYAFGCYIFIDFNAMCISMSICEYI